MNPLVFRRIRGPVFILCFGLTAILSQWYGFSFARSWPIYLLAAGLLRLGEAALPWSGVPYGIQPVRRASVTGAMFELLAGVVALLLTTGTIPIGSFWRVYSRWWPLLLVLLGVFLLGERLFDRRGIEPGYAGVRVRPRRHSGLVFLVLLLAALGLSSQGSRSFPFSTFRWDRNWSLDWDGETHENDLTFSEPIDAGASLAIDNARGDVEITPSGDGRVHVDAHQTAHGPDRGKERAFAATRPVLQIHGAAGTLSVPGRNGVDVKLVVRVPDSVQVTVRTHHGDVAVSGLARALSIEEDHGDVAIDSVRGPVRLQMDHGDLRAHALGSDLAIDGHVDDVTVSGVHGRTTLNGEFFGDTEIDGAGGPVSFHSNRTELEIPRLTGSLSLDGENLRVEGASGGLRIETRSKDIQASGVSGPAVIGNSNGDVSLALVEPLGAVSLTNSTGNMALTLPPDAGCAVRGSTGGDDEIESDFPLAQNTGDGGKSIHGQIGKGGPLLELKAEHGDLRLRRGSAGGSEAERHLRSEGEPPAPVVQ